MATSRPTPSTPTARRPTSATSGSRSGPRRTATTPCSRSRSTPCRAGSARPWVAGCPTPTSTSTRSRRTRSTARWRYAASRASRPSRATAWCGRTASSAATTSWRSGSPPGSDDEPVNEHVRRVAGWLPAVVLVPAALVTGVVVTAEDDELDQVRAVHPLDVGTTWVYAVSDHGSPSGTRTRQVTGKAPVDLETLDGVAISSHYTDYPDVGETSQLIYVGATDGRLVQYGLVSDMQASFLEPPAPLY